MKKTIYGVFSGEALLYCTDTKEEAKEDCEKFNKEQEISNEILQDYYYYKEVALYTK